MVNGAGQIPEPHKIPVAQVTRAPKPEYKPQPKPELQRADQVTISPQARQVSQVAAKAKAVPEVRPERVAEARLKVGKAPAAAQDAKIAEKLLTES